MPKFDATLQKFTIVDTGSTERDISAYIEDLNADFSAKLHDDTAPGSTGDQSFRGIKTGGAVLRMKWARGDAVDPDSIFSGLADHGSAVAFEYFPGGETSGYPKYSGSCFVEGWRIVGIVGEMVKGEATLKWDNGWTRGTVSP